MNWSMSKKDLIRDGNTIVIENENTGMIRIQNESGDGVMTVYNVFPGVFIMYNDFHMDTCESAFDPSQDMLCIDHCREGRMEQEVESNAYTYLGIGDMKVDTREHHTGKAQFPLRHFHGVSVVLMMEEASRALPVEIKDFPVNLESLRDKFCKNGHPLVIESAPEIAHIFSELYTVPAKIRSAYFKVKVLELLLFLDALELPENQKERPYFYKTNIEKVKAMRKLMCENLDRHYTVEEISKQFSIPLTALKICFKSVYGDSIFSYMRTYRMNQAAIFLRRNPEHSIATIAGMVGYESPSKFSTAFQTVMGQAPLAYRNSSK